MFDFLQTIDRCNSSELSFDLEPRFVTSLEVIQKVMNVPECALMSLLHQNGYGEVETTSNCIDEEMLVIFSDAYIRKMRSYFLTSMRNTHLLTPQESADLEEFCQTFKKQDVTSIRRADWNLIDSNLIRDAFVDKIKKRTPQQETFYDNLKKVMIENLSAINTKYFQFELYSLEDYLNVDETFGIQDKKDVLDRVTESIYYHIKIRTKEYISYISLLLRKIYVSARYRIYSKDDDSDDSDKMVASMHLTNNLVSLESASKTISLLAHKRLKNEKNKRFKRRNSAKQYS